jgi:predicted secreted hydrolase
VTAFSGRWTVDGGRAALWLAVVASIVFVCWMPAHGADWKQAAEPWKWNFPRDHGSHPEFRTEWWYFTGNLFDEAGKQYGYQLTFFRQGISLRPKDPQNPWSIRDLYLAHFTLTDVSASRFWYDERASRKGPDLAGAANNRMDVRLLNWSARMEGNTILIEARWQDMELLLKLTPRKPLVFHGEGGLSKKGANKGQASYYYSYTDLQTHGTISIPGSRSAFRVKGTSWFDHEFGSNQLAQDQAGWDWFSLHLSSGQDVMIYMLRRKDGSLEPASSGTLVDRSGKAAHLKLAEIGIEPLSRWKSPQSGATYPNQWRITIPTKNLQVIVAPLVANQELITGASTGVTYWEGAVSGAGTSDGSQVTCEGYVEMTGYSGSLGGIF